MQYSAGIDGFMLFIIYLYSRIYYWPNFLYGWTMLHIEYKLYTKVWCRGKNSWNCFLFMYGLSRIVPIIAKSNPSYIPSQAKTIPSLTFVIKSQAKSITNEAQVICISRFKKSSQVKEKVIKWNTNNPWLRNI